MNSVALVTMFLGLLIIATRGWLLFAPGASIRQIHFLTATHARIRGLGLVSAAIACLMLWSGQSEEGTLAGFLLVVGGVLLFVAVPLLVAFPQIYKGMIDSFVPQTADGSLIGWRVLGVFGVLIGGLIFLAGLNH